MRKIAIIGLYHNNKFLLQHRSSDAPNNPSKWGLFGGGLEGNETPLEGIKRECFEELKYALKSPKLIHEGARANRYAYVFIEAYDPSHPLTQLEGDAMGWFSFDEAMQLDIVPYVLDILKTLRDSINNSR